MPLIPFENIPHQSALQLDYRRKNPRLMQFYNGHHRQFQDISRLSEVLTREKDFHRKFLSLVLREINSQFGLTEQMERNLNLLERQDSLTVITGQQPGIYTGPLYTILKAITVIKIAGYLSQKLEKPVIPLFWVENSDHDLAEVNHIFFPGYDAPLRINYGSDINLQQKSIGSISLGRDFDNFAQNVKTNLPNNDFFAAVTRLMDETYFPGETFGQAFGKMMIRLLGRYGLILIDSENHELKKLASPVITMKLLEKGRMNQLILEQSEALQKENYDHQIKIRSELLNVFILKDNNRIPLTLLGEMMSGNGEKVVLEDEELLKLAQEHPERFSPKVAFRPIVQDFLFPTVVYVGGPSELAYFAQLKKVYQFFDIEMPIIWPRTSATLIDAKIQRHIQRTGIVYEDIFRDHQQVQREIITRNMPETQEKVFEQAKSKLQGYLNWLSQELSNLDPALASQSRTPFKKMEYQLQQIHQLSLNKLKSQDSSLINSWQKIQLLLFPKGKMQERVYNIIYFLSRYGFWLMDYLMENLDIETDDHQILEIPSSPEK